MNQKIIIYSIFLIISTSVLFFLPEAKQASAHISRVFGDYNVEVGWDDEPVYASIENSIFISVNKGSENDAKPVINALKNMQISVKYGTISKQIDFLPSVKEDGAYTSSIIPTRVGTYTLILKGEIEGQKIDDEIILDDVSSIDTLNFPQANPSNNDNTQLDGKIIDNLAKSAIEVKESSDVSLKIVSNLFPIFQDLKNSLDMLYMINMTVIGIGISAILISILALKSSKKEDTK